MTDRDRKIDNFDNFVLACKNIEYSCCPKKIITSILLCSECSDLLCVDCAKIKKSKLTHKKEVYCRWCYENRPQQRCYHSWMDHKVYMGCYCRAKYKCGECEKYYCKEHILYNLAEKRYICIECRK